MKKLVNKDALNRIALCACFLSALPIAQGAEPITIAMTADHWQTKENTATCRSAMSGPTESGGRQYRAGECCAGSYRPVMRYGNHTHHIQFGETAPYRTVKPRPQ